MKESTTQLKLIGPGLASASAVVVPAAACATRDHDEVGRLTPVHSLDNP
jgi:hypothetical protein